VASSSRARAARSFTPWRHLGALGFYLFWIVAASGIYVYAFFDTSVTGAHASLERLAREQWWLGGVMRSLHRYASDAFVLVALAHLVREALAGHFRGFRWFSWASGVLLLWFLYGSGVIGYWLVWDGLAQFSATATAEWFDALGLGAGPMVRNFLAPADVTDRLFSLLVFLHIGIPLAMRWMCTPTPRRRACWAGRCSHCCSRCRSRGPPSPVRRLRSARYPRRSRSTGSISSRTRSCTRPRRRACGGCSGA